MSGMSNRSLLVPGKPTPIRTVPDHIERPEYVWKDEVRENIGETFIQPPEVIEAMREASKIAANALKEVGKAVAPGVTTDELDRLWPGMADRLRNSRPAIRKHINVFVDGERVSLDTRLAPGATVWVLTAISGG